jgi:peptidyl-prolyl cis-trans isomerase SurA
LYNEHTMKKFLLILCLFAFLRIPFGDAQEELLDRVIAVVNDEIITQSELDSILRPLYEDYREQYSGEELVNFVKEARQKILNQLIEDRLVYQEAVAQKIVITEDEIDRELEDLGKRMEGYDEINSMLEREGMTMKVLREKVKKQLMIRRLQDIQIRSRVVVSPAEIESFYKENPEKFQRIARVKIKSLTVKKSAASREQGTMDEPAKDKIKSFYLKIKQGENFDDLVREYSEDSRAREEKPADWIEKGSMIESVDEAIFSTPQGQLTGIVESPIGFHIFRVEEKEDARQVTFGESREQISGYLFQAKSNERFKEWTEQLKRAAYISIR